MKSKEKTDLDEFYILVAMTHTYPFRDAKEFDMHFAFTMSLYVVTGAILFLQEPFKVLPKLGLFKNYNSEFDFLNLPK